MRRAILFGAVTAIMWSALGVALIYVWASADLPLGAQLFITTIMISGLATDTAQGYRWSLGSRGG
jgi:hypothetical protein